VPEGSDIRFESDGLRDGGRHASAVAEAAAAVAGQIAGVVVDPAVFGQLPAAAALGAALAAFRDGHAELGRQVQAAHAALAGRAGGTAGDGDRMAADTTAVAQGVSAPQVVP
jgi:hypothetical protein